jgi:ABC-type branched-subunit amino acid transport system ATPase component
MSAVTTPTVGLEVRDLVVAYGGNIAVNRVSFAAHVGAVSGLIGPNGAGKTTIFNACSGLLRPRDGSIWLFGDDVTRSGAAARARRGLGRTFQLVNLCSGLTVQENVALGAEALAAGANPLRQLVSGASGRRIADAASAAIDRCGLGALATTPVASLSTGQRRLVELARVVAADYRFVLLDEPSSGLDDRETDRFGEIVAGMAAEGRGILLVEHDMTLVMGVCSAITVLDFGNLIFQGPPAEVQTSEVVRAAYLGQDG